MRVARDDLRINKIEFTEYGNDGLGGYFNSAEHAKYLDEFIELALPAMNNTTVVPGRVYPIEGDPDSFPNYDLYMSPPKTDMFRANEVNAKNMELIKNRLNFCGPTAMKMGYSKCVEFFNLKHTPEVHLEQASRESERQLKSELELKTMDHITLRGEGWSSSVQDAIENYALTKPFHVSDCPDLTFFLSFFERLFDVPLESGSKTIRCQLHSTIPRLSQFRKSQLINHEKHKVEWRREDGFTVSVVCRPVESKLDKPLWQIKFHM